MSSTLTSGTTGRLKITVMVESASTFSLPSAGSTSETIRLPTVLNSSVNGSSNCPPSWARSVSLTCTV